MATTQPNLPNYQLSRAPEMQIAALGQMNQNLTTAMDNLVKNQKAKKAKEEALDKEARTVQNSFLNEFGKIEGSLIGQMDKANRTWARETANTLNAKYTKAYGSDGTQKDKDDYMDFQSQAMYNIKVIGTNATFVANNQKAISTNELAKSKKSKNVGLLSDNYLYEEGGEGWYEEGMKFKTGQYTSFRMKTLDNGQIEMVKIDKNGNEVNTNLNARYETYTKNGKDLNSYIVGEDDLLSTHSDARYKSSIEKLLDADNSKQKIKTLERGEGGKAQWLEQQTITYPSLQELEANNPQLSNQINQDLNSQKMPKFWAQMRQKELVNGGVKGTDVGELPWHFLNSVNDDKLKEMIGPKAKKYAGIADPTPNSPWTSDDLQVVRDGVNAKQDEAATQAWLVEYQKYRPEGKKVTIEMSSERVVGTGAQGKWKDSQKIKYNANRAKAFQGYDRDDGVHVEGGQEKVQAMLQKRDLDNFTTLMNKANTRNQEASGVRYITGAQLKTSPKFSGGAYGNVSNFVDDEVYTYRQKSKGAPIDVPRATGITSQDFNILDENTNYMAQLYYQALGFDLDDQFMLTPEKQLELNKIGE